MPFVCGTIRLWCGATSELFFLFESVTPLCMLALLAQAQQRTFVPQMLHAPSASRNPRTVQLGRDAAMQQRRSQKQKSLSVTQPWERNALFSVHLSPMHPGSVGSAPSMWPVDAVLCGAGRPWQPDPIQREKCRPAETSEQNECNCNR